MFCVAKCISLHLCNLRLRFLLYQRSQIIIIVDTCNQIFATMSLPGKESPQPLSQLAVTRLVESLEDSIANLDSIIAEELRKRKPIPVSQANIEKALKESAKAKPIDLAKLPRVEHSRESFKKDLEDVLKYTKEQCGSCPIVDSRACAHATFQMMQIRNYILKYAKPEVQPIVLREVIAKAMESRNIPLVRLVLKDGVDVLDFRALDRWHTNGCSVPSSLIFPHRPIEPVVAPPDVEAGSVFPVNQSRISSLSLCNVNSLPLVIHCLPPDEFDWFSRDRMGKIISPQEACELFSIMRMTESARSVRELYINSRRPTYWACPSQVMDVVADSILEMTRLTTLVLRGMCDDHMLRLIGQTAKNLKRLDVSASQFVTDDGIKNLFFNEVTENAATYLIQAWIQKNMKHMNSLVYTLETLDYSWTSVTTLSRKMVQHLPGSYMFKRVFARSENECYGHHIFIRQKADLVAKIPAKDVLEVAFERSLGKIIDPKGIKSFVKFSGNHPWAGCLLCVHLEPNDQDGISNEADSTRQLHHSCYGIIIPNEDERRVHGVVNFKDNNLNEIYSAFPTKMGHLGESCPKLKVFKGILNGTWKFTTSFLPELSVIDAFADPATFTSLLENSPNLKRVRIRIIRHSLTDNHLMTTIASSMCSRTLEELWIAPGSYKSKYNKNTRVDPASAAASTSYTNVSDSDATTSLPVPKMSLMYNEFLPMTKPDIEAVEPGESPVDDLITLSMKSLRSLISTCPKLYRVGDIAWWSPVTQEELEGFCDELKKTGSKVYFIWENTIFSPNETLAQ